MVRRELQRLRSRPQKAPRERSRAAAPHSLPETHEKLVRLDRRNPPSRRIFLTGGSDYLGSRLIPLLAEQGCRIVALARPSSILRLPPVAHPVMGNALESYTFIDAVLGVETFIQLVGVPRPASWKGSQFRAVDLVSCRASIEAAKIAGAEPFIYMSGVYPARRLALVTVLQMLRTILWTVDDRPDSIRMRAYIISDPQSGL